MPLVEVEGKLPAASVREKAKEKAELGTRIASRLSLVPLTGLEPVLDRSRGILSPLCLPIPPQRPMDRNDN